MLIVVSMETGEKRALPSQIQQTIKYNNYGETSTSSRLQQSSLYQSHREIPDGVGGTEGWRRLRGHIEGVPHGETALVRATEPHQNLRHVDLSHQISHYCL